MVKCVIEKFGNELQSRLDPASQLLMDMRLCEDRFEYSVGPHTDELRKLYSILIYASDADGHEHLGTRFYRPIDPNLTDDGNTHFDFGQFVEAGSVPYRPNTAVIFPRTDRSFHGVPVLQNETYVRRLILVNAYIVTKNSSRVETHS